jgi:hypothetical protein
MALVVEDDAGMSGTSREAQRRGGTTMTQTHTPRSFARGLAVLGMALLPAPLRAQEAPPTPGVPPVAHAVAHAEEHEHSDELAVFLGGTGEDDGTHFTLGAEYDRRLGERFGLAFVGEHVDGTGAWVFLAPFTFRPARNLGLELYAGPGFETKEEEHPPEHAEAEAGGRETLLVLRTGAGWAVELGRASITPQVELDLVHEHDEWRTALVFGVAVGFGF